jgi:ABC-type phosphate transport system substrate-binding protein
MRPIMPVMNRVGFIVVGLVLSLSGGMATADQVPVVSAKNPVSTLTRDQVIDIFLGKENRFPDGRRAVPIDQAEGSPARDEFYLKFAGKSSAQVKAYWSKIFFTGRGQLPREVSSGIEAKKHIVENPNAIGYIERSMVDGSVKVVLAQ